MAKIGAAVIRRKDIYGTKRWHYQTEDGVPACGQAIDGIRQVGTLSEDMLRYGGGVCRRCVTKVEGAPKAVRFTEAQAQALHERAFAAGQAAAHGAQPTAMVVGTPKDPVASLMGGDGGGFDPEQPIHIVNDGVCGFAWVVVRNRSFARRMKLDTAYGGGHRVGQCGAHFQTQSYERRMAAATAYAEVLRAAGVEAYPTGRLD